MSNQINQEKSLKLFAEAQKVIPGGVNSPVRAFSSVGGTPLFIKEGVGAYVYDEDHNQYLDYVCSWGPLILGHAHPEVLDFVKKQADRGVSFGAPTEIEVLLAQKVCEVVGFADMVRFVNSGTEATMTAIRLARGFTSRDKVLKFDGCYHGHSDSFLVNAGSGVATNSIASCSGVTEGASKDTISIPYNDLASLNDAFEKFGDKIACVIVEPVAANMGLVLPKEGFLESLREVCTKHGALLIFDEVMTGFRLGIGGAAEYFGIDPDIATYGKIVGGGLPVGAVAGRRDLMQRLSPIGDVYQAGTLSGNPLAMASGYKTLEILQKTNPYRELKSKAEFLASSLSNAAEDYDFEFQSLNIESFWGIFFNNSPVLNFEDSKNSSAELFKKFFWLMLEEGVYIAPSSFEVGFICAAHSDADIEKTIEAARKCFGKLRS